MLLIKRDVSHAFHITCLDVKILQSLRSFRMTSISRIVILSKAKYLTLMKAKVVPHTLKKKLFANKLYLFEK